MEGRIRILQENELLNGIQEEQAVFPVTSDMAVFNTLNVSLADYAPYINVNSFTKQDTPFTLKPAARMLVPSKYRHCGMILTYRMSEYLGTNRPDESDIVHDDCWVSEQFYGNVTDDVIWADSSYWKPVGTASSGSGNGCTFSTVHRSLSEITNYDPEGGVFELHRVARTGLNSHLIGFVGKRDETSFAGDLGEIFSVYDGENINRAEGEGSAVFGMKNYTGNTASFSFVTGGENIVNGSYSFATGINNELHGAVNAVFGKGNTVADNGSTEVFVAGNTNTGRHNMAAVFGAYNVSTGMSQTVIGRYNEYDVNNLAHETPHNEYDPYAFIIGNGENEANRSDALKVKWNGELWAQYDVLCGGTDTNPQHRLTEKFDTRDLVTDILPNNETYINRPVSYELLQTIYNQFLQDHRAYFFNSTEEMIDSLNSDDVRYLQGDLLYVRNAEEYSENVTIYPAFFVANENLPDAGPYTYSTLANFIQEIDDAGTLGLLVHTYGIGQLKSSNITFGDWQPRLYDTENPPVGVQAVNGVINLKTITLDDEVSPVVKSLLVTDPNDTTVVIPRVSQNVEDAGTLAVSGNAVLQYVENTMNAISPTKTVNTTNTASLEPMANESLFETPDDSSPFNLHKISKTGINTDLIDFVGIRDANNNEIFNSYDNTYGSANNASEAASYAHVEGFGNFANGSYSHVAGQGNISTIDHQYVIGKYADSNSHATRGQQALVMGWGSFENRNNIFTVSTKGETWSKGLMYVGGMLHDELRETDIPDLTIDENSPNNVLVHKYYVDNLVSQHSESLYKGFAPNVLQAYNPNMAEGTLHIVENVSVDWRGETKTKSDIFVAKTNSTNPARQTKQLYDVLGFTSNPSEIQNFYIVGGTGGTETPILLHKVAQTGNYNDLSNMPSVVGFPSVSVKFYPVRYHEGNTGETPDGLPRFIAGQGEYEANPSVTHISSPVSYWDNTIDIVFDCEPQWVVDNILNNENCRYYVQIQRPVKGEWKTVWGYRNNTQESSHLTKPYARYRSWLEPINIRALSSSVVGAHLTNVSNTWEIDDPHKKIRFTLKYTIRDILAAFCRFDNLRHPDNYQASCFWDVIKKGSSPIQNATNRNLVEYVNKPVYIKGIDNASDEEEKTDMNWFAASFRIGVVEYPDFGNSKMYYGPSYWNNFKAMFKYWNAYNIDLNHTYVYESTMRFSGKLANNRIKL